MNSQQLSELQTKLDRLKAEQSELPARIREVVQTELGGEELTRLIIRRDTLAITVQLVEIDLLEAQIAEWESELMGLRADAQKAKEQMEKAIQDAKDAQRRRDLAGRDSFTAQDRAHDMNQKISQEKDRLAELKQQSDRELDRLASGPKNTLRPRL